MNSESHNQLVVGRMGLETEGLGGSSGDLVGIGQDEMALVNPLSDMHDEQPGRFPLPAIRILIQERGATGCNHSASG
jgi:hypothetical protein